MPVLYLLLIKQRCRPLSLSLRFLVFITENSQNCTYPYSFNPDISIFVEYPHYYFITFSILILFSMYSNCFLLQSFYISYSPSLYCTLFIFYISLLSHSLLFLISSHHLLLSSLLFSPSFHRQVESLIDSLPDSIDYYDSIAQDPLSDLMEDSDVLDDTFRDLIAFNTPPVADPCIYSATISSLSHNRLAKEATLLLKSYSQRGVSCRVTYLLLTATVTVTVCVCVSVQLSILYFRRLFDSVSVTHHFFLHHLTHYQSINVFLSL